MASQRARASKGATHWVEELCGVRPRLITRNIARVSTELMIEETRQQRKASVRPGEHWDADATLKLDTSSGYRWVRLWAKSKNTQGVVLKW